MVRLILTDAQWAVMEPHCMGKKSDPGRTGLDGRMFVEAVLWIARTGSPWRDLPPEFGHWNSAFKRFRRWVRRGVFDRMFEATAQDADLEYAMVDGTIVKGAPCSGHRHGQGAFGGPEIRPSANPAAAAARGHDDENTRPAGRTLTDALGNLVRFVLLPGQRYDTIGVAPLIDGIEFDALLADKAFDANWIIAEMNRRGAAICIPQRPNRKEPLEIDPEMYEWRHLIENFFGKLKEFKRIAMRACKTDHSFKAMINLAATTINLR